MYYLVRNETTKKLLFISEQKRWNLLDRINTIGKELDEYDLDYYYINGSQDFGSNVRNLSELLKQKPELTKYQAVDTIDKLFK